MSLFEWVLIMLARYVVELVVDDWVEELPVGVAHAAASGVHSTVAWD